MNDKADLEDALRCLSVIPNTEDTLRMVIKVDESATPRTAGGGDGVTSPKKQKFCFKKNVAKTNPLPPTRKKLSFEKEYDCEEKGDEDPVTYTSTSVPSTSARGDTPIDRYIRKTEQKIEEKKDAIERLSQEERAVRQRIEEAKSNNRNAGSLCSNCHLRLGHTIRTCIFERCSSVFKCGEEKQHPGENDTTKKARLVIARLESEKKKLEAEIQNKKEAAASVRSSVVNRLENELFLANNDAYVSNGVKNWSLLRRHVFVLQSYCKKYLHGKIPPKHKIMSCLQQAIHEGPPTPTATQVKTRTCRENPFKEILQKQGVVFPSENENTSTKQREVESELYRYAPRSKLEEDEQLKMVLCISADGSNTTVPENVEKKEMLDAQPIQDQVIGFNYISNQTNEQGSTGHKYFLDTSEIENLLDDGKQEHPEAETAESEIAVISEKNDDREVANLLLSLGSNNI